MRAPFLAAMLSLAAMAAHAQNVALAGILGSKALLVVDGGAPRAVAAGEAHQGVHVVSVGQGEAVVDVDGGRRTLRLGEAPVSVATPGAGQRLVLKADARGHFVNTGFINGRVMQYMVDTGASTVAIGLPEAQRMGLKAANGTAQGWRVRLDSVRAGTLELRGVDAIVTPQPMPYVLLGNSFLRAFEMSRTGDEMVLQQRP
jgi:aspartyl protease family protein